MHTIIIISGGLALIAAMLCIASLTGVPAVMAAGVW